MYLSTNNKTKQYNITYYDNMCNVRLNFKLIAYYCAEIMRLFIHKFGKMPFSTFLQHISIKKG